MKIKTLSAHGLKATGDFTHELAPVTIITGPNWSGKTARLDAIRLALIGYLPELGKTNQATFELAGQADMSVSVKFDDHSTINRRWRMHRGKVSAESVEAPHKVPPVLMDPNVYFALGDIDRVRYVFGMAKVDLDKNPVDTITAALKGIRCEPHNEHHEAAIREACEMVDATDRRRHDAAQPVQEWLSELIAKMRDGGKAAKQNSDRMAKMVEGMAVVKSAEDDGFLRNCEAEVAGLRAEHALLAGEAGALSQRSASALETERKRARYSTVLTDGRDYTHQIEDLADQINQLAKECSGHQSTAAGATSDLRNAQHLKTMMVIEHNTLMGRVEEAGKKLKAATAAGRCPTCGSDHPGWDARLVSQHDAEVKPWGQRIIEIAHLLVDNEPVIAAAEQKLAAANERDKAHAEKAARLNELRGVHAIMTAKQAGINEAKAALSALPIAIPIADADRQSALLAEKMQAVAQRIIAVEQRQLAFVREQQDTKRCAQARLEYDRVRASVEVIRAAIGILETLQAEMVRQAFVRILDRANRLTAGLLRSPLEFRDGDIGRTERQSWVPHRTFSGTEKAVAYAAISYALAADSPCRIVLLDELGRLEFVNKTKLVERLISMAAAGEIDQAVVVDVDAQPYEQFAGPDGPDVNVIWLG